MTAKQRTTLTESIIQGGIRRMLRGEHPFKPLSEQDSKVEFFRDKVSSIAARVGVDFDAVASAVIEKELHL